MSRFTSGKNTLFLTFLCFVIIGIFCTKKDNPTGPQNTEPIVKKPTITIISPASDTLVESITDSVHLKAIITNSEFIDSMKINNVKISPMSIVGDTLSVKIALTGDTTKIIPALFYQSGSMVADTITIARKKIVAISGMAKISGTLLQGSTGKLAKRLNKSLIATNAQGVKTTINSVIPISGADIMVYNSEALSTSSDTIIQTDSLGNWAVEMKPGNYFIFAVYFDRANLEIVTTSLPDIKAEKDKETVTDSAVAVSDDIKPMLMAILDAAEANKDNIFLPSNIPSGLPIVMSFSEPMTRASVGDSIKGIVLGRVNSDSSDLPLLDTIPVKKLWGPDGKELRIIPLKALTVGVTYKVVVPSSSKDLALNKLDKDYSAVFEVTNALTLPPFAIKTTSPLSGDTILPGFPVELIFSRPVDALSLNKKYTLTSSRDSTASGFFEVKGTVVRFVNKKLWLAGASYSLSVLAGTKDLVGDSLGKDTTIIFTIKAPDSLDLKVGIEGSVAATVNKFMGAYVAGDIENFSQNFHSAFELIESTPDGQISRIQLATFLEKRRLDIEARNRLAKYGLIAPVFYYPVVNGKRFIAWKLIKGTVSLYLEDLGPEGGFGKIPHVFTMSNTDITDSVKYVNRGIIYNGETLYFAPDMSKAFLDKDARENDPSVFGKLLRSSTHVQTQDIMLTLRSDFTFRNLSAQEGKDTAQVMIELVEEEHYTDGKRPGPIADPANPPPEVEKHVMAIQTKLLLSAGKWMVIQMVAKELYSGDKAAFKADAIKDSSFVIKNFEQTRPVNFISPKHKSTSVASPIVLKWSVEKKDGIGGYLVAIANELSGGNQGLLIFTRKDSLILNQDGSVTGGTILSIDPKSITIPIPHFSAKLMSFTVSDSAVYVWKVIALPDTAITSLVAGGMLKVIADSDFGNHGGGLGFFTLMATMPDISGKLTQVVTPVNQEDRFADRDGDFYPNWLEKAFGTNPNDPGSFPNFSLDTDLDGYADFLELLAGSDPEKAGSIPVDINPADKIPDALQARPEWRPELAKDDDKDGFPNEIEILFGTDPWNPQSKPSKAFKASVPVNNYFGGLKLGDQGWKRINFSLLSDSTGNWAFIDTTELQGIERNGVDITRKLMWLNGEWVFFIKVVNGSNTGKFIKIRFHQEGSNLRGPVDMADMENGGGPCIGEFFASHDSIKDFTTINGGQGNPIINTNPDGPVNLGPPPADRMKRPDSGSVDLRMKLTFADGSAPLITLIVKNDSVKSSSFHWAPGQSPSLGFDANDSEKKYHIDGSLHKIGNPEAGKDTLVLIGNISFDEKDAAGGMFRQLFNYTLLITGITDPKKPSGEWKGWFVKPMGGPVNSGPLPFIGTKEAVDGALRQTSNEGIIMETQKIVTISSVSRDNVGPWSAVVDTAKYFIMEVMGDPTKVMIKEVNGKSYIALSTKGPNQGPGPGPNTMNAVFKGDSTTIVTALVASGNKVKVSAPSPFVINVNPASLRRESDPSRPEQFKWSINDAANPDKRFIFIAKDSVGTILRIEEDKPVVIEVMIQQPQRIPFSGDSTAIVTALAASSNRVSVDGPNAPQIEVNPATLKKMSDPNDPTKFGFAINGSGNLSEQFIFMGQNQDSHILKMNGNLPVVFKSDPPPPAQK
jgi:hypothetical protein